MFAAIDLKSFYASVECVERGLDPLDTCLVVADSSRTDKTICLAVSPTLKSYGVSSRPRLFEVNQKLREVNRSRRQGKSASGTCAMWLRRISTSTPSTRYSLTSDHISPLTA